MQIIKRQEAPFVEASCGCAKVQRLIIIFSREFAKKKRIPRIELSVLFSHNVISMADKKKDAET